MRNVLETFGRSLIPQRFREPLRQYLLKAGYEGVPYDKFGVLFFSSVVVTYIAFLGLVVPELQSYNPLVQGIATLVFWVVVLSALAAMVGLGTYFVLNLKIYSRVHTMETALPDYLQLVVTNLRSGMNFEQSLWAAAKPEFGVLSNEIAFVSKRVMTGSDTAEALQEFGDRYDSPTLQRTVTIITSELSAGGEIAKVIDRVIGSLKKTKDLKEEMAANVLNFIIFIAVIVIVLAPILFALANTLLQVVLGFAELLSRNVGAATQSLGSGGSIIRKMADLARNGPTLTANFRTFSAWAIGIIAFASSMIVSILEKGDIRGGIKYIPLFTITSLVLFFIFLKVFTTVFGGLVAT